MNATILNAMRPIIIPFLTFTCYRPAYPAILHGGQANIAEFIKQYIFSFNRDHNSLLHIARNFFNHNMRVTSKYQIDLRHDRLAYITITNT